MTHLSQEELILSYYRELGAGAEADARAHLDACGECRDELMRLSAVLDQVNAIEVPEPEDGYETRVWERLSWKLKAEERRSRSARPLVQRRAWFAAAAMMAIAFATGVLITRRDATPATVETATKAQPSAAAPVTGSTQQQRDRILLVVVGDHFDESERVLVELANLTPAGDGADITTERARAEELLASNRLYRSTALDRGEENVATILDELEPVLLQIAHSPSQLTASELRRIQKRVEAKGLVFKLRVVRAGVRQEANLPQQPTI